MPYIEQSDREVIGHSLEDLIDTLATEEMNDGTLNYVFTKILMAYLDWHGGCYVTYERMIGILECAKLELYRRRVAEYEDHKRQVNGDAYL